MFENLWDHLLQNPKIIFIQRKNLTLNEMVIGFFYQHMWNNLFCVGLLSFFSFGLNLSLITRFHLLLPFSIFFDHRSLLLEWLTKHPCFRAYLGDWESGFSVLFQWRESSLFCCRNLVWLVYEVNFKSHFFSWPLS